VTRHVDKQREVVPPTMFFQEDACSFVYPLEKMNEFPKNNNSWTSVYEEYHGMYQNANPVISNQIIQ